ncbi:MAG: sigma-54 dependent transcriptional regulator [Gemmatimonadales bacterium]
MPLRLLLVEDDPAVRRSLSETLSEEGHHVRTAASAEEALIRIQDESPELILSDIRMPGLDGIELLKRVQAETDSVDVILMTAYDDMPTVVRAMREGAFDFLVKPLELKELRSVLDRVLADRSAREQAQRSAEEEALAYSLDALVGHDPRMIELYKLVGQLAASRVTVLIRGDTGTGKEMVARAIHYNSADRGEPFIPVNCSALPESLLESELFGHVRGAFTGAVADHRGRFALAARGTVFLDEIGDTTAEFQGKLLRVLEDGDFYPVGAERAEQTEARVIAATHRNLEEMISAGTFREDLYYRLRVVEIRLPPLRERLTDLSLLARHFIRKASQELHRSEPTLADEAASALLQHDWPGNVRELENCLTRAVVLATGNVIRPEHLGLRSEGQGSTGGLPTLDELARGHVKRVLVATGGNKTRAAEILGISKPKLYRMLEKGQQR